MFPMQKQQKIYSVPKTRRRLCGWRVKGVLKSYILAPWMKLLAHCPDFLLNSQVIIAKEALRLEFIRTRVREPLRIVVITKAVPEGGRQAVGEGGTLVLVSKEDTEVVGELVIVKAAEVAEVALAVAPAEGGAIEAVAAEPDEAVSTSNLVEMEQARRRMLLLHQEAIREVIF
jgi:hypothetical protein